MWTIGKHVVVTVNQGNTRSIHKMEDASQHLHLLKRFTIEFFSFIEVFQHEFANLSSPCEGRFRMFGENAIIFTREGFV